ncbi:hypothetical protein [Serratia fonticola]|uniref:hypothetical protein n=1 Tax=Serratia fonticola TaxID=47917 RepID=UPI0021BAA72E|nr:hypothetical protein [Serratia fonticola]
MSIKFFLNVCNSMQHSVEVKGNTFSPGFQGPIKLENEVRNDMLHISLPFCGGHTPFMGNASHIVAVSVRVCPDSVSTIAIYDDLELNAMGHCCHCSNGCSTYASGGCGCED